MKKLVIGSAVAAALSMGVSTSANAALASNAILNFDDGVVDCAGGFGTYPACTYGTDVTAGSYFGMDTSGDGVIQPGERNALTNAGTGVTLGAAQGIGDIDVTWSFGGNPGNHLSPGLVVSSTSGNTATIDMTGWTVNWNGGDIDMGAGTGTYDSGTEVFTPNPGTNFATVTCGVDCSVGDSFTLDYAANVPSGGFAGFGYTLHLEGTVSAVPVPAAVWLFGSGLVGLAAVARRRKAA